MRAVTRSSACSTRELPLSAALRWLARFPMLGESELAALLGGDAWAVADVRREAARRGWVASIMVDSPEFETAERLFYLTDAGVAALAEQMDTDLDTVHCELPVSRGELLARLARVETAVSVARFCAWLADDLRCQGEGVILDDARSTHWAPRGPRHPDDVPTVEAVGRLRQGAHTARFALAWDRSAAPYVQRQRRVAAWYRADEVRSAPRVLSLPPVLVVCSSARVATEWTAAVERSADRRHRGTLRLAVAVGDDLNTRGSLRADWWRPGGGHPLPLLDLLAWRADAPTAIRPSMPLQEAAAKRCREAALSGKGPIPMLHRWAAVVLQDRQACDRLTDAERWAALTVRLSATQKTVLIWVAHHPLLPLAHLAMHLGLAEAAVARLMAMLVRYRLVTDGTDTATPNAVGQRRAGPGYILTDRGAGWLAARDGVRPTIYLRDGCIAVQQPAPDGGNRFGSPWPPAQLRLADLRRHPEHTAGIYQFALALGREAQRWRARGEDHRLLAWLNAAEAQEWFRWKGGFIAIRPDARFRYRVGDTVYDLLLEWDRGLVRRRDYARKFAAYAAYLASDDRPWDNVRLLMVTTDAAVARVHAAVVAAAEICRQLTAITYIITQAEMVAQGIGAWLWPEALANLPGCAATRSESGRDLPE